MASEHDLDLVARIAAGDASGVLTADDPAGVLEAAGRVDGTVPVDVDDLPGAIAGARIRLAELVVARARRAEADLVSAFTSPRSAEPADDSGAQAAHDADRDVVRFSLAILVPALAGGIAVYLADGLVLAAVLPAVALAALGGVVLAHRRPDESTPEVGPGPEDPALVTVELADGPAVRTAEAHLRRQQAAWKLVWWERAAPVPDLASWSPHLTVTAPLTLVSVDPTRRIDAGAHETMTATAPDAVRVLVLRGRG